MKKHLLSFCCVLLPLFLVAQTKVIISELLYDTPLSESSGINRYNGEFVSICNYGDTAVDVSGWNLVSDGAGQTFTFPQGSIMQSGAKFYVAYRNVNGNFSLSDLYNGFQLGVHDREFYQRALVHANTGESLRLYRQDGTTQDSLYYDGTSGKQPRLEALNQDSTLGNQCVSLQRINVTIADDVIIFNKLDYAAKQVALRQYSTSTLTENGVSVAYKSYINQKNHIFEHVDKSKISTGLLSDYGLHLADPNIFDGTLNDSNAMNIKTLEQLYVGMVTSKVNDNITLTPPATVYEQIDGATHATAVPIVLLHYQYNQLKEDVVSLGLMQLVNEQLYDVPGSASPYLTKQLFAVAPKNSTFDNTTVNFVFNSGLFYKNVDKTVQKLEINFNNESGYLLAHWGIPVSYTFSDIGEKIIYFRLTYTDGTSYASQTRISITNPTPSTKSNDFFDTVFQATSRYYGGTIQYRFSPSNTTGKFRKPLIVAEGFDPSCLRNGEGNIDIRDFLQDFDGIQTADGDTLLSKVDSLGYDIIYLDYHNGVDDIWRNAELFKEVIRWVNSKKIEDAEQNIVMGISMGGLVASIALRQMEKKMESHQTRKYISMDAPHRGANVPMGFQEALAHMKSIGDFFKWFGYRDLFEEVFLAIDLLNSWAAKQMLIYNQYCDMIAPYIFFQEDYWKLGLPHGCENIAISNGSNSGRLNFSPGSPIVIGENLAMNDKNLKMDIYVNALTDHSVSRIYQGKLYYLAITLSKGTTNSTDAMLPLDGAPGGVYSIDMMGVELPTMFAATVKEPDFCFIPTVSALALSDWQTKLTQPLTDITTSPFRSVFVQGNNEPHTWFNSSADFLYSHLKPPFATGPNLVSGPTEYDILNAPMEATASWELGPGLVNTLFDMTPHTTLSLPGGGAIAMGTKSVTVRPADGVTSCFKSWLIPTVTYGECSFTLDTVHVYVGYPPDPTAIGSKQHYTMKRWGGRNMYCSFLDTITYAGNLIQTGNSQGITSAVWIPAAFNEVSVSPYQTFPVGGETVLGIRALHIGSYANLARIGVSLKNQCGWSDTVAISYFPDEQCKGLLLFFSPNPTNNTLTVEFDELPTAINSIEYYSVKLYDNAGTVQRQKQVQHRYSDGMPQPITFDTSTLRPGTYYLHVEGAGELVREQVIVIP